MMTGNANENNWIIRIQDGKHFFQQGHNGIWAIRNIPRYQNILKNSRKVTISGLCKTKSSGEDGKLTAYGKYDSHFIREVGTIDRENKKRGWTSMPQYLEEHGV